MVSNLHYLLHSELRGCQKSRGKNPFWGSWEKLLRKSQFYWIYVVICVNTEKNTEKSEFSFFVFWQPLNFWFYKADRSACITYHYLAYETSVYKKKHLVTKKCYISLNYYFHLHVCPSMRPSVRTSVRCHTSAFHPINSSRGPNSVSPWRSRT